MKRDWTQARAKVEVEGQCRLCNSTDGLEAAHIIGRSQDKKGQIGSVSVVFRDRVIPLCKTCHMDYDSHRIDIGWELTGAEWMRAILDTRRFGAAFARVCPYSYRKIHEEKG